MLCDDLMSEVTNGGDLPLLTRTPIRGRCRDQGRARALERPHLLEKKAAFNALELLNRWPEPDCPHDWVSTVPWRPSPAMRL